MIRKIGTTDWGTLIVKNDKLGAVLIETCMYLTILLGTLYFVHFSVIRNGVLKLENLQKEKFVYDGEIKWNVFQK